MTRTYEPGQRPSDGPKAHQWTFTIYPDAEPGNNVRSADEIYEILKGDFMENPIIKYGFFGRETCPSTQRKHAQGFMVFTRPLRLNQIKSMVHGRAHWEKANGSPKQNWNYCTKQDKEPFTFGDIPTFLCNGEREKADWEGDWVKAKEGRLEEIDKGRLIRNYGAFKRIRDDYAPKPAKLTQLHAEWIWGTPGSGKTTVVDTEHGEEVYEKSHNKWWDNYNNEEVVVINDLDPTVIKSNFLVSLLKTWMDLKPFPCEMKGSSRLIRPKKFIITSNYSIDECFSNPVDAQAIKRRCRVRYFNNFKEYDSDGTLVKDHTWDSVEEENFNPNPSPSPSPNTTDSDSYYNDEYFQKLAEEDEDEILNGEYDENYFIDLSQEDEEEI